MPETRHIFYIALALAIGLLLQSGTALAQDSGGYEIPEECAQQGRLPPPHWTRETNGNAGNPTLETETWRDLFQSDFPLGSTINGRVRSNRYLALSFNPGTAGTKGGITFTDLSGDIIVASEAPALVSISACPGDFRPQSGAAVNCRRLGVTAGNGFRWSRLESEQINKCVIDLIDSGADLLYFNITYVSNATADGPAPDQLEWACRQDNPTGSCGHRMQPTAQ